MGFDAVFSLYQACDAWHRLHYISVKTTFYAVFSEEFNAEDVNIDTSKCFPL